MGDLWWRNPFFEIKTTRQKWNPNNLFGENYHIPKKQKVFWYQKRKARSFLREKLKDPPAFRNKVKLYLLSKAKALIPRKAMAVSLLVLWTTNTNWNPECKRRKQMNPRSPMCSEKMKGRLENPKPNENDLKVFICLLLLKGRFGLPGSRFLLMPKSVGPKFIQWFWNCSFLLLSSIF